MNVHSTSAAMAALRFRSTLRALAAFAFGVGAVMVAGGVHAESVNCPVTQQTLKTQLQVADAQDTSGSNLHFWAVVVNRDGVVCAVAFSGPTRNSQFGVSRAVAAAKAFTGNGLSLDSGPVASGQLYASVQPGGQFGERRNPLFGLNAGNPVDPKFAYQGNAAYFGTVYDPMVGKRIGGTISFGGGLGLFSGTTAVGGVGLSGDTACADHSTAWRLRELLDLAPSAGNDRLTLDDNLDDFGDHPHCPNDANTQGVN